MPLSFEQFKELRTKGLSPEQISKFETGFKPSVSISQPSTPEQEDLVQPGGVKGFFRGLIAPAVITAARGPQAIQSLITGETPEYNIPTGLGKVRVQDPFKEAGGDVGLGIKKAVGRGAQTVALGAGSTAGGALFGAGTALEEGKGLKETAIRGVIGAATGKGLTKGTQALTKLGKPVAEKLVETGFGLKGKLASRAETFLKEGIVGTKKSVLEKTQNIANKAKKAIASKLEDSKSKLSVKRALEGVAKGYEKEGTRLTVDEIRKRVARFSRRGAEILAKNKVPIKEADKLRSGLDKTLGAVPFIKDDPIKQFNRDLTLKVANKLRGTVQKVEPTTREPFKRQAAALAVNKALSKKTGLRDTAEFLTTSGGSALIGSLFGKEKEFGTVGTAIALLRKGVLPKTLAQQALYKGAKLGEKPSAQAVINFLSKLGGREVSKLELTK